MSDSGTDETTSPQVDDSLDAYGASCADLTPLIKAKIVSLPSGGVLEVHSDDPAAREGVPAWSRLTGNPLIASIPVDKRRTRFYLRRK